MNNPLCLPDRAVRAHPSPNTPRVLWHVLHRPASTAPSFQRPHASRFPSHQTFLSRCFLENQPRSLSRHLVSPTVPIEDGGGPSEPPRGRRGKRRAPNMRISEREYARCGLDGLPTRALQVAHEDVMRSRCVDGRFRATRGAILSWRVSGHRARCAASIYTQPVHTLARAGGKRDRTYERFMLENDQRDDDMWRRRFLGMRRPALRL